MVLRNPSAGKEGRRRCREWTCGHSGGGESGTHGESSISIYTLLGARWIAGEELLCGTGSPVWHSVMTWRDGRGKGGRLRREGMYVQWWLICIVWQKQTQQS